MRSQERRDQEDLAAPIDHDSFMRFLSASVGRSSTISPDRDELSSRASWLLIRASSLLQKDLEQRVHRPAGLSWSAFRVLYNVSLLKVAEPTQLAKVLGIAPASVSSLLTTLTKGGLVTRTRNENNQARVHVELTPLGREKLDSVISPHGQVEKEFMSALPQTEREQLVALLEKLLSTNWPT